MTKAQNVINRIHKTMLKYDLEIARVESEIALYTEKIKFYSCSTNQKDIEELAIAKINEENYRVFLNHLVAEKNVLNSKIVSIASKYQGEYAKIFTLRYFDGKRVEDISEELKIPTKQVWQIVNRFDKEILD